MNTIRTEFGFSRALRLVVAGIAALAVLLPSGVHGQASLPAGFSETRIRGISSPTSLCLVPDGRVLVNSQGGQVIVIKNDVILPTPMLSLNVSALEERGLDGIQVDPNFAVNGFLYIYYAVPTTPSHNRLSRFTVTGDIANPASELVLFELPSLSTSGWHNGGCIKFGPDGKLYFTSGENNIPANAQSMATPMGKILRINSDGTIPTDNPFLNVTTGNNRAIYALGFRNPYTMAFQPGTGRLFVNDVGSFLWEEINEVFAGGNYGWPTFEGFTTAAGFQSPVHTYPHPAAFPTSSAITGGTFYNPDVANFPPQFVGKYFFADGFQQFIKVLDPATKTVTPFAAFPFSLYTDPIDTRAVSPLYPTVGPNGFLYYLARSPLAAAFSSLNIIRFVGGTAPQIGSQPLNQLTTAGGTAVFDVGANGNAPLSFQWSRMNAGAPSFTAIPGATGSRLTLGPVSLADNGAQVRCTIANLAGSATSTPATLTVVAGAPPVPTITLPVLGSVYRAGDTINFEGFAVDPIDGTLPPANLSWRVDFQHLEHTHPVLLDTAGISNGNFFVSPVIETSPAVWFRIQLTATDSSGLSGTTFHDVLPVKSTNAIATVPPGLQVIFDGHAAPTPTNWIGVVGVTRTLGAPDQFFGGSLYTFDSWSDGGAVNHDLATPELNTTFTARFRLVPPVDNAAMTSQTIPTRMTAGNNFTVSVRMQNTGNTLWPANSTHVLAAQNPANNTTWRATPVPLPIAVNPGESFTFTFPVTAPATAGLFNLQWQMQNAGVFFGAPADNTVVTVVTVTTAGANGATFVSQSVPLLMAPGGTYNVLVTLQNTGTAVWSAASKYRLGSANPQDNTRWGFTRVGLTNVNASSVAPGETQTFNFRVKAPLIPGQYQFQWRMVQELVGWFGQVSANQIITVTATPPTPPTVPLPPASLTVAAGQPASFFAGAIGSGPITFQWQRQSAGAPDFTAIPGAITATLRLDATTGADDGARFRCVVTNPAGSATSASALLTVSASGGAPPTVAVPPTSQPVAVGTPVGFSVSVNGTSPFTYQWERKNPADAGFAAIALATAPTFQTAATVAGDNGAQFRCVINNAFGSATSAPATLTVTGVIADPPTIVAFTPAAGLRQLPVTAVVQVVFSKDMDPATINASTLTLIRKTTTVPVAATVAYNPATRTAALTPTIPLKTDWSYNVTVVGGAAGVKDLGGLPLATSATWVFYTLDTLGPRLFNITVSAITQTSATIKWDSNENADSQILFGQTIAYGQSSPLLGALVLRHSVTLNTLTPGTLFNYQIRSRDGFGNLTATANATFTTTP